MAIESTVATRVERLMAVRPEFEALEALLLVAVLASRDDSSGLPWRGWPDTGRLARWLGVEHAIVRRTATTLQMRGWLATAPKGGRSPALILSTDDPGKLRALIR